MSGSLARSRARRRQHGPTGRLRKRPAGHPRSPAEPLEARGSRPFRGPGFSSCALAAKG